jgi:hypothetical protein
MTVETSTYPNLPAEQFEIDTSLSQFIGAAKGCFATPDEATQFIRQERDAWHSVCLVQFDLQKTNVTINPSTTKDRGLDTGE